MEPTINVLMVGLSNSGKTTLLHSFLNDKSSPAKSTKGFNTKPLTFKEKKIVFLDVDGEAKLRSLWKDYVEDMNAIMFVVDSASKETILEASSVLIEFLNSLAKPRPRLLILCNKCDSENVLSVTKVNEALKLNSLTDVEWFIMKSSGITGQNKDLILDWIVSQPEIKADPKVEEMKAKELGEETKGTVEEKEIQEEMAPRTKEGLMMKQLQAIYKVVEYHTKVLEELKKIFRAGESERIIVAEDGTVSTAPFNS